MLPKKAFMPLRRSYSGSLHFTKTKSFAPQMRLDAETVNEAFDFAFQMTFGHEGSHRDHRSGGTAHRKLGEIFANTFQGKAVECAVSGFLAQNRIETEVDFSVSGLGQWDSGDLCVGDKVISVKSAKYFSNLLLLEANDWDRDGLYRPGNGFSSSRHDFFVMGRLCPDIASLMKKHRFYYSNAVDRTELEEPVLNQPWSYDIPGFITIDDLKTIVQKGQLIHKGARLGTKGVQMDATNYYVQTGDMRPISELVSVLSQA